MLGTGTPIIPELDPTLDTIEKAVNHLWSTAIKKETVIMAKKLPKYYHNVYCAFFTHELDPHPNMTTQESPEQTTTTTTDILEDI